MVSPSIPAPPAHKSERRGSTDSKEPLVRIFVTAEENTYLLQLPLIKARLSDSHLRNKKSLELIRPHARSSSCARFSRCASTSATDAWRSSSVGGRLRAVQNSSSTISAVGRPLSIKCPSRLLRRESRSLTSGPLTS